MSGNKLCRCLYCLPIPVYVFFVGLELENKVLFFEIPIPSTGHGATLDSGQLRKKNFNTSILYLYKEFLDEVFLLSSSITNLYDMITSLWNSLYWDNTEVLKNCPKSLRLMVLENKGIVLCNTYIAELRYCFKQYLSWRIKVLFLAFSPLLENVLLLL